MKAVLISRDDRLHKQVTALCAARTPAVAVVSVKSGLPHAYDVMAVEMPQLVIFDGSDADAGVMVALENLSAQYRETSLMLLTADQSTETLLRAMRAGVREVLPLPLEQTAFENAVNRVAQKFEASAKAGKVISFIGCKGGAGATFIATNLGYALAEQANKKVLLIDLNQQFGDAALYMSEKKPTMTLSDICTQINRLDRAFLESSLINVTPNFGILAGSDDPARSNDINPDRIDTVLRVARSCYDYVILDVGRQIDAVSIHALDQSDVIHPVLQMSMPYIRDAGRLLEIFHSLGYRKDKTRLLVNRYDKGGELRLSDLQKALTGVDVQTIPNNYKAANDSVNQGVPLLKLARSNPISKSLIGLVNQMVGWNTSANDKGILMRLFNNRVQASIANG